jgi:hypothetical protein
MTLRNYCARLSSRASYGKETKVVYAQDTELKTYNVKVVVHYEYEVEAETEAEAEEQGWAYEDYAYNGEVYSIKIEELESEEDDE